MSRKPRANSQRENTNVQQREDHIEAKPAGQGTLFQGSLVEQSLHVGPLPAPETFDHYERILPGSAERIVTMAEEQGKHRRRMEAWVIVGGIVQSYLGTVVGGCVAVLTIWWSVGLIRDGFGLIGLAPTIGALASLVGVFIFGRRQQNSELEQKREQ